MAVTVGALEPSCASTLSLFSPAVAVSGTTNTRATLDWDEWRRRVDFRLAHLEERFATLVGEHASDILDLRAAKTSLVMSNDELQCTYANLKDKYETAQALLVGKIAQERDVGFEEKLNQLSGKTEQVIAGYAVVQERLACLEQFAFDSADQENPTGKAFQNLTVKYEGHMNSMTNDVTSIVERLHAQEEFSRELVAKMNATLSSSEHHVATSDVEALLERRLANIENHLRALRRGRAPSPTPGYVPGSGVDRS